MTRPTRERAPQRTTIPDDICDGCTLGCGDLWLLRTPRGRALRGRWCDDCIMEKEAMA